MRQEKTFSLLPAREADFAQQALQWALQEFSYVAYYSSCGIPYPSGAFPHMLGVGHSAFSDLGEKPFKALWEVHQKQPDWLLGYFTYDLKNSIHGLTSQHPSSVSFPSCTFFPPEHILFFEEGGVRICSTSSPEALFHHIQQQSLQPLSPCQQAHLSASISRTDYLQKVLAVKEHIREGDCYELNLCMEFVAESYAEDPLLLFRQLNRLSPAPFTTFQKYQDKYLISASPERFLKKEKELLTSQPIKGTARRGASAEEDAALVQQLRTSEKERAENMMIVDLVRNDLAQSCQWGSVAVPELFGIYSFRQVHQMISTISGSLRPELNFCQAIERAFPMGSMTGAPKHMVMQLIEQYETAQRGLYSGAAGFITPEGDFDFNVVIRSFLYDQQQQKLSFSVGSAITWDSDPEQEYQECLLKAKALLQVVNATIPEE